MPTENYQEATIAGKDQFARDKLSVTDNYPESDLDMEVLKRAILGLLEAGMSDTRIIKEVMGYSGGNYPRGKALLEELKRE